VSVRRRPWLALLLAALALIGAGAAALAFGGSLLGPREVWSVLTGRAGSPTLELLVLDVRLPRVLAAALVGASLAAAGALMQGVTRNPLASPGLMGLNAGGGLAMLLATLAWPRLGDGWLFVAILGGAAGGAALAFGTAALGRGRASPERLALAGVIVSGLLTSVTGQVVLYNMMTQDRLSWTAGGLYSVRWDQLAAATPVAAAGLLAALTLAPRVTVLALGTDVAGSLGLHPARARVAVTVAVLLLVAASLALAGPVAFVGLMVPHLARRLVGPDYRVVVPASILLGAALTLLADLAGRCGTFQGADVPLGVYTALLGAGFFIVLARGLRTGRSWAC
jgi:iron complex transport system permease protein